nr:hypothetical protein [Tanacetum cinerariifolium]
MSWTGLPKCADDTVTDYSRPSPAIESTFDDAQNRNPFEASSNTISPKSFVKFVKENDNPTKSKTNKVETSKKPPVKDMTGNISYLSDYEPFDGGYVSFGQGGCKITGKRTIKIGDILKKFGYSDVKSSNTPIDKENPWGKDETGKDVDLHLYRSMIGSLMYLTASKPDIMFDVCGYARHQVIPKECHLHAVKRIFRYLKGHPKLGLWYHKESPFDLVAYSD